MTLALRLLGPLEKAKCCQENSSKEFIGGLGFGVSGFTSYSKGYGLGLGPNNIVPLSQKQFDFIRAQLDEMREGLPG